MNIAILNFSGNTGKTTLAKHLFAYLLPNSKRIQIEDVNLGDGEPDLEIAASNFKNLAAELNGALSDEHYVIDIGASNAKAMMGHFANLKSTRSSIDFWVIPVVPSTKQCADSLSTARALIDIGVKSEKIVMILNNIIDTRNIQNDFRSIFEGAKLFKFNVASQGVLSSEIFDLLKDKSETIFDMYLNTPDFSLLMKTARANRDKAALAQLGMRQVLHDLAESTADNLQAVFDSTPIAAQLKLALA